MSELMKWTLPRALICAVVALVLPYCIVAFALWDVGWPSTLSTWEVGDRALLSLIYWPVAFLTFWFPYGMEFLRRCSDD